MQTIKPTSISGSLEAPASKSMMQRAIAIAALTKGTCVLHGYSPSNDSDAALSIAYNLGATISKNGDTVIITGNFSPRSHVLNCGEAGLGIRMFTPIASLHTNPIILEGEGSLTTRPIHHLEQPLRDLGVDIKTNKGFVPISVCGPLQGGTAELDGSLSSQILTGLLLASPLAKHDTRFIVKDLKSKPYIDMTLQIMQDFGVEAHNADYTTFTVQGNQAYTAREYTVEGDWSGASFLLVAGALGGSITVHNISIDSKQADLAILTAIRDAGAEISLAHNSVQVSKKELRAFEFDATECPDLFPPLVALAAHCKGVTKIKGASRLKHKESDRATVLQTEFAKIGTSIEVDADTMLVYGGTVSGGRIHAHNDHRIAMAGACVAILADSAIEIENPECVAKSYPDFFADFAQICTHA